MARVLIVEDDLVLNNGIVLSLRQDNFDFCQAFTVKEAGEQLRAQAFDLIILDINLPDGNGFELCQEIRQTSLVPIIMLTANDLELDIVSGLELGADDYITKPFSLMVLRSRVAALLRRSGSSLGSMRINLGEFVFDFDHMKFFKNGRELSLSKTEQRLLKLLVNNRGTTLTRSLLIDRVWSDGAEYVDENALSVSINRLRKKLEDNPSSPDYIHTVYGIGYLWDEKKAQA